MMTAQFMQTLILNLFTKQVPEGFFDLILIDKDNIRLTNSFKVVLVLIDKEAAGNDYDLKLFGMSLFMVNVELILLLVVSLIKADITARSRVTLLCSVSHIVEDFVKRLRSTHGEEGGSLLIKCLTIYMHHWRGSVYKLHIYTRPLLDDYKKGKKINDLQLIMCGDMFKEIISQEEALKKDETTKDFISFCGTDSGYGTNSLLEQWKKTKRDDDYDPYDDDLYESHDISENLQAICDELDITVHGSRMRRLFALFSCDMSSSFWDFHVVVVVEGLGRVATNGSVFKANEV
nr:hypothetical protein [Tanacetum cinerariifolium]